MTEHTSDRIHDRLAATYGYATDADVNGRLKVDLVRRYVDRSSDVLDVGSANGLHLRLVAPLCARATGIDVNVRMIDLARERLVADGIVNAQVVRGTASDMPFDDASFDVVYSYSTLLLVPEIDAALDEIVRVLRPGGVALLDVTGRWNLSQRHWRRWYREQGHFGLHAFSWSRLEQDLERRGLAIAERHATGVTTQWRYLRGAHRLERLAAVLNDDVDLRISNLPLARSFANRWYVAARKPPASPSEPSRRDP